MKWSIEYFELEDTTQPAEIFEDELYRTYTKLAGKLRYLAYQMQLYGHQLGGGYVEKCHSYENLWEIRAIHSNMLARELFGFDRDRIVLLHGYVKRVGQPASERDLRLAYNYWLEYMRTRRISPIQEGHDE